MGVQGVQAQGSFSGRTHGQAEVHHAATQGISAGVGVYEESASIFCRLHVELRTVVVLCPIHCSIFIFYI